MVFLAEYIIQIHYMKVWDNVTMCVCTRVCLGDGELKWEEENIFQKEDTY